MAGQYSDQGNSKPYSMLPPMPKTTIKQPETPFVVRDGNKVLLSDYRLIFASGTYTPPKGGGESEGEETRGFGVVIRKYFEVGDTNNPGKKRLLPLSAKKLGDGAAVAQNISIFLYWHELENLIKRRGVLKQLCKNERTKVENALKKIHEESPPPEYQPILLSKKDALLSSTALPLTPSVPTSPEIILMESAVESTSSAPPKKKARFSGEDYDDILEFLLKRKRDEAS